MGDVVGEEEEGIVAVVIREYDPLTDCAGTAAVDGECEVRPAGGTSLHADLLGDPVARIRHSPAYLMLVAKITSGPGSRIVGLVRGTVKSVSTGTSTAAPTAPPSPASATFSASASHLPTGYRRMGIALRLVRRLEQWFVLMGAEYAYMATDRSNEASLRLFTGRCGYTKFRTPSLLVHPVHAHRLRAPRHAAVIRLGARDAERLYRCRLAHVEFFPTDIGAVLDNPLSLGTFLAVVDEGYEWRGVEHFLASPPASWAVASLWDCGGVFRLEVRGVSRLRRFAAATSRALDRAARWLRVPSVPNFFRPFAAWFAYGLGGEGSDAALAAEALFASFVNMARGKAAAVAVEVAACDPLRRRLPHWRNLSCMEDLWCMKRLGGGCDRHVNGWDWVRSAPRQSIFLDPREV